MICPKCGLEYRDGYTKCADCGDNLIVNDIVKQNDHVASFIEFGRMTAKKAIMLLFLTGLVPLLYTSVAFGKYLYLTHTYMKSIWFIQNGQKVFTEREANNLTLGIFGGIVLFIVIVLAWKVVCELLFIIFRAIETYTKKNEVRQDSYEIKK